MIHTRSFHATGTEWWIGCDAPALLPRAEAYVHAAEQRLSRFLPDSSLCTLNRRRFSRDPLLAEVVRVALRMRELTGGAFDPTLGARLRELGYDASFEAFSKRAVRTASAYEPCTLRVEQSGDELVLHGEGELDLGGIAKGFIVDRVVAQLAADGCTSALVDGGGDICALGGPWAIELPSGHVVSLQDAAIATSSACKRRWRDRAGHALHHVLDPRSGQPTGAAVEVATLRARETAVADALATAALVDAESVCGVLLQLDAHAALRDAHGFWWTSARWELAA